MSSNLKPDIVVRNTRPQDISAIIDLCRRVYPNTEPWTAAQLESHLNVFPDGQFVAIDPASEPPPLREGDAASNVSSTGDASRAATSPPPDLPLKGEGPQTDRVVGMASTLCVGWDDYDADQNWRDFTDHGMFTNHDPAGTTLYAAEVMVDPQMQGRGIGKKIYKARRDLCRRLGKKRIRAGARLRGYRKYAGEMSPEVYVQKVVDGEIGDPTLSFQIKQGFRVFGVVHDYLQQDPSSQGHAALIEWINPQAASPAEVRRRDPRFSPARKKQEMTGR